MNSLAINTKKVIETNPQVGRAIKNIISSIIKILIKKEGCTLNEIEKCTGMHGFSLDLVANILKYMEKDKSIQIINNKIIPDREKLIYVLYQEKTMLPNRHNKLWTEDEYVFLIEQKINKVPSAIIAKQMHRTEGSINLQMSTLRKAKILMPIMKNNPIILKYLNEAVSPNPMN